MNDDFESQMALRQQQWQEIIWNTIEYTLQAERDSLDRWRAQIAWTVGRCR